MKFQTLTNATIINFSTSHHRTEWHTDRLNWRFFNRKDKHMARYKSFLNHLNNRLNDIDIELPNGTGTYFLFEQPDYSWTITIIAEPDTIPFKFDTPESFADQLMQLYPDGNILIVASKRQNSTYTGKSFWQRDYGDYHDGIIGD